MSKFAYAFAMMLCMILTSCYHMGTVGGSKSVILDEVSNRTSDATLGGIMAQCMREELGTRPGLSVKNAPIYVLDLNVSDITSSSQARAEVRVKNVRDRDGDAYQSVLHKVTVKVDYEITDKAGKSIRKGQVSGIASLPLMHDREVAMRNARTLALKDAARMVADALADCGK